MLLLRRELFVQLYIHHLVPLLQVRDLDMITQMRRSLLLHGPLCEKATRTILPKRSVRR